MDITELKAIIDANIFENTSQAITGDALNDVLNLIADSLGEYVPVADIFDEAGTIRSSLLPSYVDDVLEFSTRDAFPAVGEGGKIYLAADTNLSYRWGGSEYVIIAQSLALGETSSTAYRGDRGKIAYEHSQTSHRLSIAGLEVSALGGSITTEALASALSIPELRNAVAAHIGDDSIHITADERAVWNKIASLFGIDDSGDIYIKADENGRARGFYTKSFLSSGGKGESSSGGGSADYTQWGWDDIIQLTSDPGLGNLASAWALKQEYDSGQSALSVLSQGISSIRILIPSSASESNQLADKEFVNSSIASNPNGYISGISKAMVENVLTGNITSHTHSFASLTSKPTTISGYGITDAYTKTEVNNTLSGYLPLGGGIMTGNIIWNTDSHGIYFYNGGGIEKWEGYSPALVAEGNNTDFYIRKGTNRDEYYKIIHSGNYNSYAPTLTGAGASGTWGISISGNAASATQLQTPRTIWGQSFDGTANINGNIDIGGNDIIGYGGASILQNLGGNLGINPLGYVGIGTTSPSAKLHVAGNAIITGDITTNNIIIPQNCKIYTFALDQVGYTRPIFGLEYSGSTDGFFTYIQSPDNDSNDGVKIKSRSGSDLVTFLDGGNVGIGTTSPSEKLHVYGNILASGAITAGTASDARLKSNIATIVNASSVLRQLRGVGFDWNALATDKSSYFKGHDVGLIAQEVERLIPSAIGTIWGEYKRLDYTKITPYLVEGWKAHDDEIQRLKTKIKQLEERIYYGMER